MTLKEIVTAYDNTQFLWYDATGNLMCILAMHENDFKLEMIHFKGM